MIEFKCSDCGEKWGSKHKRDCPAQKESMQRLHIAYGNTSINFDDFLKSVNLYDCDDDIELPYDFDLLYDVKRLGQLLQLYWQSRRTVETIEEMACTHGIDLGDCAPWGACDDCCD